MNARSILAIHNLKHQVRPPAAGGSREEPSPAPTQSLGPLPAWQPCASLEGSNTHAPSCAHSHPHPCTHALRACSRLAPTGAWACLTPGTALWSGRWARVMCCASHTLHDGLGRHVPERSSALHLHCRLLHLDTEDRGATMAGRHAQPGLCMQPSSAALMHAAALHPSVSTACKAQPAKPGCGHLPPDPCSTRLSSAWGRTRRRGVR